MVHVNMSIHLMDLDNDEITLTPTADANRFCIGFGSNANIFLTHRRLEELHRIIGEKLIDLNGGGEPGTTSCHHSIDEMLDPTGKRPLVDCGECGQKAYKVGQTAACIHNWREVVNASGEAYMIRCTECGATAGIGVY